MTKHIWSSRRWLLSVVCLALLAACSAGAMPTAAQASRGNVAILRDDLPDHGAASDPETLARFLTDAGFTVTFLDSVQLADPGVLNRARYDLLVLPYGPVFPVKAADSLRAFLRQGGKFLSMGGYAFDDLLERRDGRWQSPLPPKAPEVSQVAWHYHIPASELRGKGPFTFRGSLRAQLIPGDGFAYFAVYQYGAGGKLVQFHDVCQVHGAQDWTPQQYEFDVAPKAEVVEIHAGLFLCHGTAWMEGISLTDFAGKELLPTDLAAIREPDLSRPHRWWRTRAIGCDVDPHGGQRGGPALKVALDYTVPAEERLNTRHGRPADGLVVEPTQLAVFQPDFRLERAVTLRPSTAQSILSASPRANDNVSRPAVGRTNAINSSRRRVEYGVRELAPAVSQGGLPPVLPTETKRRTSERLRQKIGLEIALVRKSPTYEGYAAVGMDGYNQARWLPLIDTFDRYGRPRGPAGGMLRHYAGPYAGSSWAFFGVTNRDLFAQRVWPGPGGVIDLAMNLVRDTYLTRVAADPPCVRPGETARFQIGLYNGGRIDRRLRVAISVYTDDGAVPLHSEERTVESAAGQGVDTAFTWAPPARAADFYRVVCRLYDGDRAIDRLEGGLVVSRSATLAQGPRLSLRANYLQVGAVPRFLFGTDDWSYVFTADRETPAQWRFDASQRRDFGVQIYENLQVGIPGGPTEQEAFLRKVDGVVQLAQKYGQVYFAGLLVGANVAASDEELARQVAWCRTFARRYRDVPGIIYYPNGDLRCQIDSRVTPQWNRYLTVRYGTDEALRAAWGRFAPKEPLGRIPAVEYNGEAWDDVRAYDMNLFRAWLIRRWNSALIAGIRAENPHALTSCEFYQLPFEGVDIPEGIGELSLSNIGYFDRPLDDIRRFPSVLKYSDQRARGKSLGPGEYGVKTHPAWGDGKDYAYHIARTPAQAIDLFLAIPHYALGLGASRIHNWCWKDSAHSVFPWGMVYPNAGIEKEILKAHRNQSLLFRQFAPRDRAPEVYVLTPDSHRLGGQKTRVVEGILRSIQLLVAAHVENPGVLNERSLAGGAQIPAGAKAIFYPLPYCPSDTAYRKVLAWVRAGGTLYLSGDISYDEQRRRTRTARLEELCGVRFTGENYPAIEYGEVRPVALQGQAGWRFSPGHPGLQLKPAGAMALASAPDGAPVAVRHNVGLGRVFFLAEPMELHLEPGLLAVDTGVYRRVLAAAGIRPLAITPDDPLLHVFRVALQDGGSVYVLFNADESRPLREVRLKAQGIDLALTLAKQRPGLVWVDGQGRLRAVEAASVVRAGGQALLECTGQTILFSADGADLRRSRALVALPLAAGPLRVPGGATAAEVGEVRGGRWMRFERLPVRQSRGLSVLEVSPDAAGSIVLIGDRAHLAGAGATMQRLMTR